MKSRFSHRQVNLFCDYSFDEYLELFKALLTLPSDFLDTQYREQWNTHLEVHVWEKLLDRQRYRILSSKHLSPCKHPPPIFDDPMVRVYNVYAL